MYLSINAIWAEKGSNESLTIAVKTCCWCINSAKLSFIKAWARDSAFCADKSIFSSASLNAPDITNISPATNPAAVANAPHPNLVCHKAACFNLLT